MIRVMEIQAESTFTPKHGIENKNKKIGPAFPNELGARGERAQHKHRNIKNICKIRQKCTSNCSPAHGGGEVSQSVLASFPGQGQ